MKKTRCPICGQAIFKNGTHRHSAVDASEKLRKQATKKVRVTLPRKHKRQAR